MNYTMSRDKNIISFQAENKAAPYTFDINTAIFYGTSGKPIKQWPTGLGKWVEIAGPEIGSNVVYLMRNIRKNTSAYIKFHYDKPTLEEMATLSTLFRIADKLQSIGYAMQNQDDTDPYSLEYINKYFKVFARYIKETERPSIYNFMRENAKNIWMAENHLVLNAHLTQYMVDRMWESRACYPAEYTSHVAYYLSRGLYEFYEVEPKTGRYSNNDGASQMFYSIKRYFDYCQKTNTKPEKENFFQSYINVRRLYETNKIRFDTETLTNHFAKHPELAFESENFTVILPRTREAFQDEARQQNNCVYTYYFEDVLNGKTLVVFIRRKDNPEKSYVTCEIQDGRIIQYRGVNNSSPGEEAENFRKIYQQHLNETWQK